MKLKFKKSLLFILFPFLKRKYINQKKLLSYPSVGKIIKNKLLSYIIIIRTKQAKQSHKQAK